MSSVDVIVPCYRYAHFLRQCIDSVLQQPGPSVRVLIIDDASPDNTAEVAGELVREDPRVTLIRHSANKGPISTFNEGIDWATGDYLLVLSADDYLVPGALSRAAGLMDAHPDVGFTFGQAFVNDNGALTARRSLARVERNAGWRIMQGLEFIELSGGANIIFAPTAVVRTKLHKRLGGYRAELPHSADMEMWLRLAAHAPVGVLKDYQAVYRIHGSNMSRAYVEGGRIGDIQQRRAALDCFFETCGHTLPHSDRLRRQLFCSLGREAARYASIAFSAGDIEACDQLSDLALDISPAAKRSMRWAKLVVKRSVGPRLWGALHPAVNWMRQRVRR